MAAIQLPSKDLGRRHTHDGISPPAVNFRPFAGRIGGNQLLALSPDDPQYDALIAKAPDAAPNLPWRASLDPRGFSDVELWKQAIIEGVGTALQVFLSGLYSFGLASTGTKTSLGIILPTALGSIANLVLLALFILVAGPVSGGHFNPFITISTFCARLSTFPRTLLYVLMQCIGGIVGGFVMRAGLGLPPEQLKRMPGCYIDTTLNTPGQAYALETMTALALIFIAFGVGLDPRQRDVFGPALSPILVGFALALCTFSTGFVKEGYSGASLNPARCFGLMAASESFDYHYVHWMGDISAAILNGLLYWAIPPYKF